MMRQTVRQRDDRRPESLSLGPSALFHLEADPTKHKAARVHDWKRPDQSSIELQQHLSSETVVGDLTVRNKLHYTRSDSTQVW